jgi:hypothetical protein
MDGPVEVCSTTYNEFESTLTAAIVGHLLVWIPQNRLFDVQDAADHLLLDNTKVENSNKFSVSSDRT